MVKKMAHNRENYADRLNNYASRMSKHGITLYVNYCSHYGAEVYSLSVKNSAGQAMLERKNH